MATNGHVSCLSMAKPDLAEVASPANVHVALAHRPARGKPIATMRATAANDLLRQTDQRFDSSVKTAGAGKSGDQAHDHWETSNPGVRTCRWHSCWKKFKCR